MLHLEQEPAERVQDKTYDLLIAGGGINGAGLARDAAGRGLKVALAEMGDLAQGTSSASTKLIHGGLRYLEHYAFRLVREALAEREVMLRIAPHIVRTMRFVLPHAPNMRPGWMLRLGLFLYDHIGGRETLPPTKVLDLKRDTAGTPLMPELSRGYEYSDCWVDDARLVVLNAMDASARGADIMVQTKVVGAKRDRDEWQITLRDMKSDRVVRARALVNATGAWSPSFLRDVLQIETPPRIRLVKGSHIVVRKLFDHDRSYIFQNVDGRIVFAIPYEHDFTLIGTTDLDFSGDPLQAGASEAEISYLLAATARYFVKPPHSGSIVWSFAGIRALYDDGASAAKDATREYVLALDDAGPPLLDIYGGKITTYRKLAEAALDKLRATFPLMTSQSWTGSAPLPGGDFPAGGKAALRQHVAALFPWLDERILSRMISSYGTLVPDVLGDAKSESDLGRSFGAGLYEREVRWLIEREWARTAEDILWRRSKLGLRMSQSACDALARYTAGG